MVRAGRGNAQSVGTIISIAQHKTEALHDERAFAMETEDLEGD
jgi:hypothetical protein